MSLELIDSLIGKTIDEARSIAESHDYMVRVLSSDGMPFVCTMDLRHDRIGVHVWEGIVNSAKIG